MESNISMIGESITTYGFPIVVALIMMYLCYVMMLENKKEIEKINETHKEEVNRLADVITQNTQVLIRLEEKLEKE